MHKLLLLFLCLFVNVSTWSQEKNIKDFSLQKQANNPLAPSKAAFYSAVIPGLGQAYNKKYWKIPVIYASLGTSLYFYFDNNKKYTLYREEYKKRLLGIHDTSDPTFGRLDNERIIRGQEYYQRYRDLAMVITVGIYILNIIDANVDAHLQQFNVDDDLSFNPILETNPQTLELQPSVRLTYKF